MQANDLVTLVLGLPLLAISLWLSRRGSLGGRLLLAGTLGFVLYTNVTMCFGAAHSAPFLVYVALFSL
jgi:lipopolysaccharide export LptBFGC system permease protein LptF